jgi:hypothetical protein
MEDAASLRALADKAERLGSVMTTQVHRENLLEIARGLRDQADAQDAAVTALSGQAPTLPL